MSIVKNNSGTGDNLRTIKVLSQVDGYNINKYVHLENCGYHLGYVSNSSFYVMMRCELPSSATGYLFGIKNTSGTTGDFYVKCDATTITWAIGSDTWTKARESGVHEYGFVDGKPVYDNALVSTTAVAHSGIHSYALCIGGVHKTNNTYEYISAIDLYRFNVRYYAVASPTSSSTAWLGAFYPTSVTLRNARKVPEASLTIYHNDGATFSNSASTETVTYGVQLDDLRDITGSGYRDLMAIIAEDDTTHAESWADGEDHVRNSDMTDVRDFAFRLADGANISVSNPIPLPSGYSVSRPSGAYKGDFDYKYYIGSGSTSDPNNYSGFLPYVKGDLIYGRKPNWSIWADGMKNGKWVEARRAMKADVNMIYQSLFFLRFNIFKDFKGQDNFELLKRWDGYNQENIHAPEASVLAGLNLEFHNRIPCVCDFNTELAGKNSTGTAASQKDEYAIFKYSLGTGALAHVRIGNLAPWDIPRAQQTGDYNWNVRGVSVDFVYYNANNKYVLAHAAAYGAESDGSGGIAKFAQESTTDKTAFRDNGVDIDSGEFNQALGEGLWDIYAIDKNGRQTSISQATLSTFVKMVLLTNQPTEEITETNSIHLDYLLPRVGEQDIMAKNDPISFNLNETSGKSRFIAGELDGKVKVNGTQYDIQVYRSGTARSSQVQYNAELEWWTGSSQYSHLGYGIGFPFALAPSNAQSVSDLLDLSISANECIAFMDYKVVSEQSGYYIAIARHLHFVTCDDIYWKQNVYPRWGLPYVMDGATAQWSLQDNVSGHVYPTNLAVSASNANKVRSALFRWKDLLRSGDSDYHNWHVPYSSGTTRYPATAHLRVFQKTNGPVAWDIDIRNLNNGIDAATGQQYSQFKIGNNYYRYYFMPNDRVMQRQGHSLEVLIDCLFTAWHGTSISSMTRYNKLDDGTDDYAIGGINVCIDEIPLHDNHTEGRMTTVAQFSNVQPGYDNINNGYRLTFGGPYYQSDYVWLPNGTTDVATLGEHGSGLHGFFRIQVLLDFNTYSSLWHPGSLYVLRFNETTTYNNAKYDGTTN